jgi:hypothetical protein
MAAFAKSWRREWARLYKKTQKNRSRATTAIATSNPSRARSSRSIRKDLIAIGSVVIELGQGQTAPEAAMASIR